jgi:hypothetical protein
MIAYAYKEACPVKENDSGQIGLTAWLGLDKSVRADEFNDLAMATAVDTVVCVVI